MAKLLVFVVYNIVMEPYKSTMIGSVLVQEYSGEIPEIDPHLIKAGIRCSFILARNGENEKGYKRAGFEFRHATKEELELVKSQLTPTPWWRRLL
jgi:hypothetical protein